MLSAIVKEHQSKQIVRKERQGKTEIVLICDKNNYYYYIYIKMCQQFNRTKTKRSCSGCKQFDTSSC